ncbi:MAG: RDD family protein [Planctomycetes bacterium]|nr:RDD family protein [Planctomycetota bacterium]MCB9912388.1 RDD family protein [Planctomycetota bacterium]HRV80321.1 RDD family protein [Planctomycetota bacterium]
MKIDTHRQVETPEGLALGVRVAGVLPRGMALLVDLILRLIGYAIVFSLLLRFATMGRGVVALCLFFGEWFYYVLFEVWLDGATPGKRILGLKVLHDDGTPVGLRASLVRNFLRVIDFLPFAYGAGLVSALASPSFRRVGDWAAGTVVVYVDSKRRAPRSSASVSRPKLDVAPEPLPLALDAEEQAALLEFARRQAQWGEERAFELSDILAPLTHRKGVDGWKRVLGYAAWLEEGV